MFVIGIGAVAFELEDDAAFLRAETSDCVMTECNAQFSLLQVAGAEPTNVLQIIVIGQGYRLPYVSKAEPAISIS